MTLRSIKGITIVANIQPSYFVQEKLLREIKDYAPYGGLVEKSRILFVGAVGAGKSSTINSMSSALKNKVAPCAYVQDTSGSSVTTQVGVGLNIFLIHHKTG